MTIGQFENCLKGHAKRLENEAKQTDQLNHILGRYIASAHHDPAKYPRKPALQEDKVTEDTPEDFQKLAKQRYGKK
jgi:hypothetical protein